MRAQQFCYFCLRDNSVGIILCPGQYYCCMRLVLSLAPVTPEEDRWPGAARLRQLLAERGHGAQARLARAIGLDHALLTRIKQGARSPKAEVLAAMCRELDVSADWLLGLSDEPKRLSTADMIQRAAQQLEPHLEALLRQSLDRSGEAHAGDDGE